MQIRHSSVWSSEQDQYLREHYKRDRSATQIAADLGKGSRNAVIGRAYRLGLQINGIPPEEIEQRRERVRELQRAAAAKRGRLVKVRPHPVCRPDHPKQKLTVGAVSILKAKDHHCRAIVGEVSVGIALYCGARKVEGSSYCAKHRAAYVVVAHRRSDHGIIFKRVAQFN